MSHSPLDDRRPVSKEERGRGEGAVLNSGAMICCIQSHAPFLNCLWLERQREKPTGEASAIGEADLDSVLLKTQ